MEHSSEGKGSGKTDEQPSSASRVKFLVSYGGKILPRPQGGQLRYVGGETRMFAVSRNISYAGLMAKVVQQCGPNSILKYQLPNEDLDALISVTCDEDVENMVDEYHRNEAREGSSRLRAFLFPIVPPLSCGGRCQEIAEDLRSPDDKYIQAINNGSFSPSAAGRTIPDSSLLGTGGGGFQQPDYLFGLDQLPSSGVEHASSMPPNSTTQPDYLFGLDQLPPSPHILNTIKSTLGDSPRQKGSTSTKGSEVLTWDSDDIPASASPVKQPEMWDTKKIWEEAFSTRAPSKDDKRPPSESNSTKETSSKEKLTNPFPVSSPPKECQNKPKPLPPKQYVLNTTTAEADSGNYQRTTSLDSQRGVVSQGYTGHQSSSGESENEILIKRAKDELIELKPEKDGRQGEGSPPAEVYRGDTDGHALNRIEEGIAPLQSFVTHEEAAQEEPEVGLLLHHLGYWQGREQVAPVIPPTLPKIAISPIPLYPTTTTTAPSPLLALQNQQSMPCARLTSRADVASSTPLSSFARPINMEPQPRYSA